MEHMKIDFQSLVATSFLAVLSAGCGVDRLQHVVMPDGGVADSGADMQMFEEGGSADAGAMDAGVDAGVMDAGVPDAGALDAGPIDAGQVDAGATVPDAGSTDFDAGVDAGHACTPSGISPELAALVGGPYQNCQGGQIPRTDIQLNTQAWSGCCGELVRVCQVTGYSMQNAVYCR
jgi:hypothetical protein